ncbi:oxygenase MpaB family protein [Ilumatobacter nonamiensis]|uniref:oxygenase MpaB family protein n=1 Tax=Ilumatobacter nonamiensis TaxID=467093 RepID=UPI001F4C6E93|nr:oxygenase MpaB family protein [Ilumatobacter nonamiensis]
MTEALRSWLGDQVRTRVVGSDAAVRAAELFDTDEPGWFADDAPIRRVHADASMFVGGLRALLFQSLHPRAMAGVAQHSDYRHDPWGRLQRTADFLTATTFGPASEAQRAVEVVRRVHVHVVGTTPDGEPYAANDPHLLAWVHIAELDSFLAAHDRFGADPLHGRERDEYIADSAVIAEALGVVDPPTTESELHDQLRGFRPELRGTREARDAARYLLLQPPLPPAGRAAYGLIAGGAVSLMPAWTRWPLRLPWLPVTEATVGRAAGDAITKTLRWAITA